jgi:hypothetical protein
MKIIFLAQFVKPQDRTIVMNAVFVGLNYVRSVLIIIIEILKMIGLVVLKDMDWFILMILIYVIRIYLRIWIFIVVVVKRKLLRGKFFIAWLVGF